MPAKPKRPTRPAGRPAPKRRLPVVPIALGVVALLAVIAVLASRGGDYGDDTSTAVGVEQTRPVTVSGEPLAPFAAGGDDPAVGATAPELNGSRFDGTPLPIAAAGRPKVLLFLAHWCPHCQREVPLLAGWVADNGLPDDVDLYAIATSTTPDRPNYPPSAWLGRERFTVPTLADDAGSSAAQAFGLSGFPYFVAVDADNHVIARASGELTIAQWEALLDQARTGTVAPG